MLVAGATGGFLVLSGRMVIVSGIIVTVVGGGTLALIIAALMQPHPNDVPPGRVPLPMLDLEPSVVQEVGAF